MAIDAVLFTPPVAPELEYLFELFLLFHKINLMEHELFQKINPRVFRYSTGIYVLMSNLVADLHF